MLLDEYDVNDWMIEKTGDKGYYIRAVKRVAIPENKPRIVAIYSELAQMLRNYPHALGRLIYANDWRSLMTGIIVVVLQNAVEYEDYLVRRLVRGCWISPQVGSGVALLSKRTSISELEDVLVKGSGPSIESLRLKVTLSTYATLKILNNPIAENFEKSDEFQRLLDEDRDECIGWTNYHYNFWKDVPKV